VVGGGNGRFVTTEESGTTLVWHLGSQWPSRIGWSGRPEDAAVSADGELFVTTSAAIFGVGNEECSGQDAPAERPGTVEVWSVTKRRVSETLESTWSTTWQAPAVHPTGARLAACWQTFDPPGEFSCAGDCALLGTGLSWLATVASDDAHDGVIYGEAQESVEREDEEEGGTPEPPMVRLPRCPERTGYALEAARAIAYDAAPDGYLVDAEVEASVRPELVQPVVVDLENGAVLRKLGKPGRIRQSWLSADGATALSWYDDGRPLRLRSTRTGKELGRIELDKGDAVVAAALAPDGRWVALALTGSPLVHRFHAASGKRAAPLAGHAATVSSLAFSADGKHLISGSYDQTALVWDVAKVAP